MKMDADTPLPRDPLAPIPPSRHPFQFWILAACLFTGWVVLLKDPDTQFSREVPQAIVFVWGLLLIMSSTLAILSAWWVDRISGLLIERASLYSLALGVMSYGGFTLYSFGLTGAQSAFLTIGVGVACIWRCRHINRELLILVRLINAREE